MWEMIRWRKSVGGSTTLAFNDEVFHQKADITDYPGLLSDVLDGLLSMTNTNWEDTAEELAQLLRPAMAETQHQNLANPTSVRGGDY